MPWKRSSYLLEMESLPQESVKQRFMNKEFTTRLTEGLNSNIFNDQMIECSYMKTGKGPGGLKGKSDSPEVVKRWAFALQYSHLWIGRSDDTRVLRNQDVQDEARGRDAL